MSLILSWVLFPLIMVALGAGWGCIVERAAGTRVDGALLVPLGLAAALVVGGTLNSFELTAPAAVPVVAIGAIAGLPLAWAGRRRLWGWPMLAALGVLLAYGAPILLSGDATFAGFIRLDDTATWFNIIDKLPSGPPHSGGDLSSTYALEYSSLGPYYPRGAFILPEVARALSGVDMAWVFQPYLACCAAAVSLCLFALVKPLVPSTRIRALIAFFGAQAALLYGYSLWGGVKELTAAFLLALAAALAAALLRRRPAHPRELLPFAIASGGMIQTLGVGAGGWLALAVALVAGSWLLSERREVRASAVSIAWLVGLSAVLMIPVWVSIGGFFGNNADAALFSSGQSEHTRMGNLLHPLSAFQLGGIWPVGDFRLTAPTLPSALLIGLTVLAAGGAIWASVRRRQLGLALYVAVAAGGCGLIFFGGGTPWVVAKALAISTPALLTAGLTGAAMLWSRRRRPGLALFAVLAFGVVWSNALAYHDVLLAPRARMAELQDLGDLVSGKGPTLINEYEIYADRHFLREGDPTEPAEYRSALLELRDGTLLTQAAWADLDSFPLTTLEAYPSIVTRRSTAESRPPSNYRLAWQGRYYDLWQRDEDPARTPLAHIPFGESTSLPFCGAAQNAAYQPACSVNPVSIPSCARVLDLARKAADLHADLAAYVRPEPIVARADETLWPGVWYYDPAGHTLTANDPGRLVSHIAVASSQRYGLWLGGSFARGFEVGVDGNEMGRVKNELSSVGGYVHVGDPYLTAGTHTFILTYPHSDLTPGSGDNTLTSLNAIALEPLGTPSKLLTVAPENAGRLCGQPLDWIEIVPAG